MLLVVHLISCQTAEMAGTSPYITLQANPPHQRCCLCLAGTSPYISLQAYELFMVVVDLVMPEEVLMAWSVVLMKTFATPATPRQPTGTRKVVGAPASASWLAVW